MQANNDKPHGNSGVPCKCGHIKSRHFHNRDCIALVDPKRGKYCSCYQYRPKEEPSERSKDQIGLASDLR